MKKTRTCNDQGKMQKTTIFGGILSNCVEFLTMELRRSLLEGTCFLLSTGFQMDAIINLSSRFISGKKINP